MSYYDHPGNPERFSGIPITSQVTQRAPLDIPDHARETVAIIAQRTFESLSGGIYLGDARRYWTAATDLSTDELREIIARNTILRQVHDPLMALGGPDNPDNDFFPYYRFYE